MTDLTLFQHATATARAGASGTLAAKDDDVIPLGAFGGWDGTGTTGRDEGSCRFLERSQRDESDFRMGWSRKGGGVV